MRPLAFAVAALLAVGRAGAEPVLVGYEWSMLSLTPVWGAPEAFALLPDGSGFTARSAGTVGTLRLAPSGTVTLSPGPPAVIPMSEILHAGAYDGSARSNLQADFTYQMRLTDLGRGGSVTFRYRGVLYASEDLGAVIYWDYYGDEPGGVAASLNGRVYGATSDFTAGYPWGLQVSHNEALLTVSPVPEPSTLTLFAAGGLGLFWRRRVWMKRASGAASARRCRPAL